MIVVVRKWCDDLIGYEDCPVLVDYCVVFVSIAQICVGKLQCLLILVWNHILSLEHLPSGVSFRKVANFDHRGCRRALALIVLLLLIVIVVFLPPFAASFILLHFCLPFSIFLKADLSGMTKSSSNSHCGLLPQLVRAIDRNRLINDAELFGVAR